MKRPRGRLALALVLGLGCRAEHGSERKASAEPPAKPPSRVDRGLEVMPRVGVSGDELASLHFDPAGVWAVSGCGGAKLSVWELGGGDYVGHYSASAAWPGIADCASWPMVAKLDDDQDWTERSLDRRSRASLSADLDYLELYEGEGLAPRNRIAIPFDEDRGELLDGFVIRGHERVLVVRERDHARGCYGDCDPDEGSSYEIWSWSPIDGLELVDTLNWDVDRDNDEREEVAAWYLSEDRRWLFAAIDHALGGWAVEFELGRGSAGLGTDDWFEASDEDPDEQPWYSDFIARRELEPAVGVPQAGRIVDARLAGEVGLALIEHQGQLFVIDARTGTRVMELGALEVVDAAFAPNGERLAVAITNEVRIYSREAAEPVLRWTVEGVAGLAWRQDGAALMTGSRPTRPDRLWSLDGQPTELPADFSSRLQSLIWTVEPSWRFAIDQDGTVLRTLDMLELTHIGEAYFTDTGLFDGPAEDLHDWRLVFVEHPEWGAYRFTELAAIAHRPNLAADFFAGVSLPSPPTPSQAPVASD